MKTIRVLAFQIISFTFGSLIHIHTCNELEPINVDMIVEFHRIFVVMEVAFLLCVVRDALVQAQLNVNSIYLSANQQKYSIVDDDLIMFTSENLIVAYIFRLRSLSGLVEINDFSDFSIRKERKINFGQLLLVRPFEPVLLLCLSIL